MNRILFAGGGTAGHIEPAWATSVAWHQKYPGDEIAFLGTKSGLEVNLIPARDGKLFLIPKVTAPRKLNFSSLLFPIRLIDSVAKSVGIVKNFDVVVGFGGYVAASAYLAAIIARKPIVIHEQNAKVGIANKLGAKFAKSVAVAYPSAAKVLPGAKVVGNPIRSQLVEAAISAESDWQSARLMAKSKLGVTGKLVLILGGSSGSMAINKVIAATTFKNCTVIHSLGKENELPEATDSYRPVSYIEDMATALLAADLVISRSGAIATTEFAALGNYALFIPLPIGNGEQAKNAEDLVANHRAEVLPQEQFTSEWLNANLERLLSKPMQDAYGTNLNSAYLITECIESVLR